MPIFVNERFSNTNHITAANHALTNSGIIGGSFVFTNGRQLALTVSPVTGEVSVADGAFAFNGHLGGVILSESASYTPPPSDTSYTKNIVVIRYKRDTSTNIETYSLAVVSSEPQASEAAAEALTPTLASSTIDDGTTTAEYPLWSFIATASSNTVPVQLFEPCSSLAELRKGLSDTNEAVAKETKERKEETKALTAAVNGISKGIYEIVTGISSYTSSYTNDKIKRGDYLAYLLKFSNQETMIIPSVPGSYKKYFYKIEEISLSAANKVTEMYRGITLTTLSELYITFSGTNADNCPYVTDIYGIR